MATRLFWLKQLEGWSVISCLTKDCARSTSEGRGVLDMLCLRCFVRHQDTKGWWICVAQVEGMFQARDINKRFIVHEQS